ncbi:hypothetical protein QBC38DRAFT_83552 [Podospora fimiseda]|uniref:Uncharacterized protein n=1 Tax=Podospora fimiseda TaxID=252190 RepID=A0AAN7BUD4_9PEZI|nr:hypothetical protein QBC38DRAFT_83552 [Podospora fimiseda]
MDFASTQQHDIPSEEIWALGRARKRPRLDCRDAWRDSIGPRSRGAAWASRQPLCARRVWMVCWGRQHQQTCSNSLFIAAYHAGTLIDSGRPPQPGITERLWLERSFQAHSVISPRGVDCPTPPPTTNKLFSTVPSVRLNRRRSPDSLERCTIADKQCDLSHAEENAPAKNPASARSLVRKEKDRIYQGYHIQRCTTAVECKLWDTQQKHQGGVGPFFQKLGVVGVREKKKSAKKKKKKKKKVK